MIDSHPYYSWTMTVNSHPLEEKQWNLKKDGTLEDCLSPSLDLVTLFERGAFPRNRGIQDKIHQCQKLQIISFKQLWFFPVSRNQGCLVGNCEYWPVWLHNIRRLCTIVFIPGCVMGDVHSGSCIPTYTYWLGVAAHKLICSGKVSASTML